MPSALNILFSKPGKMGSLISHLLNEYMNMFATLFLRTVFLSGKNQSCLKHLFSKPGSSPSAGKVSFSGEGLERFYLGSGS